ncbi:hypothetical protein [Alicyclobacillus kakegawensis]|nr:hypothetical protein [Alicyclobacillus kakegawensis]
MSGHISRYNPQSRTFVRQGQGGQWQPKVLTQRPAARTTLATAPKPSK